MRSTLGLLHSLLVYYGNPVKLRRMQRFYGQLIRPGDLCFDIGAHVGNRVFAWLRLGARVVAVEPQPACLAVLRRWYGDSPNVTIVDHALGAAPGTLPLWISARHPTVTTLSREWIDTVQRTDSFAHVRWEEAVPVQVETLDALIARYGLPAFCKIDVEGYEPDVLAGLTQPLPALSFEFIPATHSAALACIDRIERLAAYEYNWVRGEEHRWQSPHWLDAASVRQLLAALPTDAKSGDIYARLRTAEKQDYIHAAVEQR